MAIPVLINRDTTLLITDESGDITDGAELGLYVDDTQVVRRYSLTLDERQPVLLAARTNHHKAAGFAAYMVAGALWSGSMSLRDDAHSASRWAAQVAEVSAHEQVRPTVERLQRSARDLIDRMVAVTIEHPA